MTEPINVVCVYMGVPGDCAECGGQDDTGTRFCSTACHDAFHERGRQHRDALDQQRANDDAFGTAAARLRAANPSLTGEQIDILLGGMP